MPTLVITGANRGLGLEFVRQYAADGWRIHATCRNPEGATDLTAVEGDVVVHGLDVGDLAAIDRLASTIDEPVDLLLNNAGVYPDGRGSSAGFGSLDYDEMAATMRVNVMAPLRFAEAFVGHLERGEERRLVNVTSLMGSIEDNASGGSYLYRTSKAALNMATRCLAIDLAGRGIVAIVIHPGWVQTDMGGPGAPLSIRESISSMRAVIAGLERADGGTFKNYDGAPLPW